MQEGQVISLSPSFSDDKLAGIAARVVDELHGAEADDFDFAFVTSSGTTEPSSADEIFQNGKIRPVYPVVKAIDDQIENDGRESIISVSDRLRRTRHPLSSLFIEETEKETETTAAAVEGRWKKSVSAGGGCNSKRWTFKSLMRRSNSYGSRDTSVVFKDREKKAAAPLPSIRDGGSEKLRSYLPYRLDIVGYFGNVNVLRKN